MPIYEYYCSECKREFEVKRPMSESDQTAACPQCGSEGQRLASGFASKTGSYLQTPGKPFRREQPG